MIQRSVRVLVLLAWASRVCAQTTGTLQVTVVDPSNAVIVGATVTATNTDRAGATPLLPAITAANGVATLANLPPGRYTVTAEFPGFDRRELTEVRVRVGDNNKQVAVLPLPTVEQSVTVEQDKQVAAADR